MSGFKSMFLPARSYWGKKSLTKDKTDDIIGIEFENETESSFELPTLPGWSFHDEGSLRNFGFEYVLKTPRSKDKLRKSIQTYFEGILAASGGSLSNSRRTSTHVHFDVGAWNFIELMTLSCLYWILEPLLIEFCGENRRGNHFCLSAKDSMVNVLSLKQSIKGGTPWHSVAFGNDYRYASLNLASVAKFGSIEFRLMRGLSDQDTFWDWVNILDAIRLASLSFSSPKDLYNKFLNDHTAQLFPDKILGTDLFIKVLRTLPKNFNIGEEVRDAFIHITPLMLSHSDWKFEKEIEIEKKQELAYQTAAGVAASGNLNGGFNPSTIFVDDILGNEEQEELAEDYVPDWDIDDFEPSIPEELTEDL